MLFNPPPPLSLLLTTFVLTITMALLWPPLNLREVKFYYSITFKQVLTKRLMKTSRN